MKAAASKKRIVVVTVVMTIALVPLLLTAIHEVTRGHGGDAYRNVYGMPIHWVSVLTIAASLLLALLVGLVVRWWQLRDDRTVERILRRRATRKALNAMDLERRELSQFMVRPTTALSARVTDRMARTGVSAAGAHAGR
jgi:hypothetical protein